MKTLRLALVLLRRDARAGELSVLFAALLLAVASVGTVGFFTDRVKGALTREANVLLGADLLISGDRPLPDTLVQEARARGLATVPVIRFNSMVQPQAGAAQADAVLADVKAVGKGYPLRGVITLRDDVDADGRVATGIPGPGEVWIDTRLADRLGASVGQKLSVGESTLKVAAIVQQDPEVAAGLFALGGRLIMNMDDVVATRLLQPGNRATWRLLIAGSRVDAYRDWAKSRLERGQRLESIRDLRPEVRQTLERAEQFLGLAALVAAVLAAAAVALAAARYLRRHLDAAAMMRCLGAGSGQALALFCIQFVVIGAVASICGCVLALGGQQLLSSLLASVVRAELPPPTLMPALAAAATGMLLLLGFALPPLIALSRVPPLRVLRRDLGTPRGGGVLAYGLGALTVAALIGAQAPDLRVAWIMIGGVAALLVGAALAARGLVAMLAMLPQRGYSWRYGLANVRRRPLAASLQIGALALGLMALLLLTLVRGDLMATWRASIPPDAPSAFLINVLPDQVDGVRALLRREAGVDPVTYPMVRGRLVAINGKPFDTAALPEGRARQLGEREFNLSQTADLPASNRVVAGSWWKAGESGGMSIEDGIAGTLGIRLGDTLTWDFAGARLDARVTSLRKVAWDSFRVNFFALFPPHALDGMPTTFITAFRANGNRAWSTALVREFPNVLVIDVGEVMHQVQAIIDQVARAVEFVFLFTLAAGVLVLEAAIAVTQDERRYDAAVMRTLGAASRQLTAAQVAEFAALGMLAGVLAAVGATAIGYLLADRTFQIPIHANPWVWLAGVVGGGVGVAIAGWLGTRSALRVPPITVLRQLA
jgi:putative ABC transport system permease protein